MLMHETIHAVVLAKHALECCNRGAGTQSIIVPPRTDIVSPGFHPSICKRYIQVPRPGFRGNDGIGVM